MNDWIEEKPFAPISDLKQEQTSVAEYKEFEPRLKFKLGLKYCWFFLKLYSVFQDLSRRSTKPDLWEIWDAA